VSCIAEGVKAPKGFGVPSTSITHPRPYFTHAPVSPTAPLPPACF